MEILVDGKRITMVSRSWDEGRDNESTGYWAPQRNRYEEGVRAKEGEVGAQRPADSPAPQKYQSLTILNLLETR